MGRSGSFVPPGTDGLTARQHPAPVEGVITDAAGEPIGAVILFLREDKLDDLEVYAVGPEPLAMPEPDNTWGGDWSDKQGPKR